MRPAYREGVKWIAFNDKSGSDECRNTEIVSGYPSVHALAAAFDTTIEKVARDVVEFRGVPILKRTVGVVTKHVGGDCFEMTVHGETLTANLIGGMELSEEARLQLIQKLPGTKVTVKGEMVAFGTLLEKRI